MSEQDESETTPRDELFEAIDHFKNAASLLFQRASPTMKRATQKVDEAVGRIDPELRKATAKAEEFVSEKVDPAFESAAKEAERVIQKLGQSAEPLAKQLTDELSKLTKRITEAVGGESEKEDG